MSLMWTSAAITDVGKVRTINEDACIAMPEKGVWVVADGMGGHEAGDVASQMIVQSMAGLTHTNRLNNRIDEIEDSLDDVNKHLIDIAAEKGESALVGSTIAALVAHKKYCVSIWAGDSRVYRLREGLLERITQDHSQVEEMVEMGELSAEEAEEHPDANIITRAVGVDDQLYLDLELQELVAGDRYMLCSDGLNKELTDQEIHGYLTVGNCAEACQSLVQETLSRGSRDNVSVVVIQFETNEQGR